MEKIMVILTQEAEYARELASYLASCEEFSYKPVVFTDDAAFEKFAQENKISLLLCDREEIARSSGFCAENVCFLSDYSNVRENDEVKDTVFKYQSTEQIKNEIMRRFSTAGRAMTGTAPIPVRRHRTGSTGIYAAENRYLMGSEITVPEEEPVLSQPRTICVCSPLGGSRCSTYALALAEYYAKKEETLFLSLDPFFNVFQEENREATGSLTELIYCLETAANNGKQILSGYVRRNRGADCLPRFANWLDVYDITAKQAHKLFSCIMSEDLYRNVIIDIGKPTGAFLECMALCDDIYIPRRKGKRDDTVIAEWKKQLSDLGFGDVAGSLRERTLPFDKGLDGEVTYDKLMSGALWGYIRETEEFGYFG